MIRRLGIGIVGLVVFAAVFGPWLTPYDPVSQNLPLRLAAPSWSHPLGLDELGRDLLARLLAGARVSLFVGCAVVGISSIVGIGIGSVAGYLGGKTDTAIGRLMDVVLALVTVGWVGYARLVRGQVLKVRELEFVQSARALGAPLSRVLLHHVIPSTFSAVSVQATLGMAGAIIAEASLSFLGLGVQPPTPSWGTMLDAGRAHLFDAPHLTVVPGAAIALLVLGFNFLGDALRDRLDPRAI